MTLEVQFLHEGAQAPVKANTTDAGYDLFSTKRLPEYVIPPNGRQLVETDLAIAVPHGTYGRIAPRSGLAVKKGIHVGAGVVDEGYRGSIGILLWNLSNEPFIVKPGERVAQLILEKIDVDAPVTVVKTLSSTQRGAAGFGSSGTGIVPEKKEIGCSGEEKEDGSLKRKQTVEESDLVRVKRVKTEVGIKSGRIIMVRGPMFASKTTTLRAFAIRYGIAKKRCLIVKYAKDKRYSNDSELITHDMNRIQATCAVELLSEIPRTQLDESDVIFLDEAQFYEDLVNFCFAQSLKGKTILVAGLCSTWDQQPFPAMCCIAAHADEIISLKAVCTVCGEDAIYTKRIVSSTKLQLIGGANVYTARCRNCLEL